MCPETREDVDPEMPTETREGDTRIRIRGITLTTIDTVTDLRW